MPTIAEYFSTIVELIRGERGDVSYHSTKVEAQGLSNRCSLIRGRGGARRSPWS
jgi:hypothetical protein